MDIKEGLPIYYKEQGKIQESFIIDVEKYQDEYLFSIDGYGTCEGNYRISSRQIGIQYFLNKDLVK